MTTAKKLTSILREKTLNTLASSIFLIHKSEGKARENYYYTDSSAGGSIVENLFYAEDIIAAAGETKMDAGDFYHSLESRARQWYTDIDDEDFEADLVWFSEIKNYVGENDKLLFGASEENMRVLVLFARAYEANERKNKQNSS
jgi:hypothetical protein